MRGSLIITFDDVDGFGGDYLDVYVNTVLKKRLYTNSSSLYSCPLYVGDVVNLQFNDTPSSNNLNFNVYRRDYTTDDEGGDNGIKTTLVDSGVTNTGVTFTATTITSSYDFEYRLDLISISCFNIGTGFNNTVDQVFVQSDNKILVGGLFTSYNGDSANRIIRLNSNGNVDTSFIYGTGFNNFVTYLNQQNDDKILIAGDFSSYNGTSINYFTRLNLNGSIDTSFVQGTGFSSNIGNVAIQTDGKLIFGGLFTSYSGYSSNRIIRLNSDGSVDTSFSGVTTGFNASTNVYLQTDGKILCVGQFTSYNGTTANRIIRLNSDASIDTSFSGVTSGFNSIITTLSLQIDGKILIGGLFTSYNGTTANRIIRLNSDGSKDTSFVYGTGFAGFDGPEDIKVQSDGKILVVGTFTSYNGTSASRIIRLNSDGSIDGSFVYGTGLTNPSAAQGRKISYTNDNRILVGGVFNAYNGITANRIIRINTNGTEDICP